jgi:hypothetical protein
MKSNSHFAVLFAALATMIAPLRLIVRTPRGRVVACLTAANDETQPVKKAGALTAVNTVGTTDPCVVEGENGAPPRIFTPFSEKRVNATDNRDGRRKPTLQRFDLSAANAIVAGLTGLRGLIKAKLRAIPVYVGHPDEPAMQDIFTDRSAKGWITGANVGELQGKPGLWVDVDWNKAGRALVEDEQFCFASPRWAMEAITAANEAVQIGVPSQLISFGLTNTPAIPGCVVANEDMPVEEEKPAAQTVVEPPPAEEPPPAPPADPPAPSVLVSALAELLGLDPAATAEAVMARFAEWKAQLAALTADKATMEAALDKATADLTTAQKTAMDNMEAAGEIELRLVAANDALKAERKARASDFVDRLIEEGRIMLASRDATIATLTAANDFTAAAKPLAAADPVVKTGPITVGLGARKPAAEAASAALTAANAEFAREGGDFTEIYLRHRRKAGV